MSVNTYDPDTHQLIRHDGYTVDSTPTSGSGNPVSSGGAYTALDGCVHKTGTETIGGNKTFSGDVTIGGNLTFPNSPNVNGVTMAMCLKQVEQNDNVSTFKFTLPRQYSNRTPVLFIMAGQDGSTLVISFLPTAGEPLYDVIHGTATITYDSQTGIVTVTASNLSWGVGAYFIGPDFLIKTIDNLS